MIVVGVLGVQFGGDYNDNFELPDTESTTAQELLADLSGGGAGTGAGLEGQVVWRPGVRSGHRRRRAQATMTALLTELSTSPGVSCVHHPVRRAAGGGVPGAARRQGGRAVAERRGRAGARSSAGGRGSAGALRPVRRQPGRHRRVRHRDLRGRVLRRPQHRGRRRRAGPDQGAERRGRAAGRCQRDLRLRRRRAAVLRGHRRHRGAGHPALRLRLDPRRLPAHRLGGAVGRPDDDVRAAARGALLRRGDVRADPRLDDRPRGRHRLLAVRHQPIPRGA